MLRRLFLALLIVLQLQPMVALAWDSHSSYVEEAVHTSTHLAGASHLHEDAHDLLLSDAGPASHVHHDAGHHSVLLFPSTVLRATVTLRDPPPLHRSVSLPDPFLEGPLRPPRRLTL